MVSGEVVKKPKNPLLSLKKKAKKVLGTIKNATIESEFDGSREAPAVLNKPIAHPLKHRREFEHTGPRKITAPQKHALPVKLAEPQPRKRRHESQVDGSGKVTTGERIPIPHPRKRRLERRNNAFNDYSQGRPDKSSNEGYFHPGPIGAGTSETEPVPVHSKDPEKIRAMRQSGVNKTKLDRRRIAEQRRTEGDRTVFIGNVATSAKRKDIESLFSPFGTISSIRFRNIHPAKEVKKSRGVAFKEGLFNEDVKSMNAYVVYEDVEHAKTAVEKCNGAIIKERHLTVTLANQKSACSKNSIFVAGLPRDADEEALRTYFTDFGAIGSIRIVREPRTGQGKGFGFVEFQSKDGLLLCLAAEQHLFQNKSLICTRCVKKPKTKNDSEYNTDGGRNSNSNSSGKPMTRRMQKRRNMMAQGRPGDRHVKRSAYMENQQKKKEKQKIKKKKTHTSSQI